MHPIFVEIGNFSIRYYGVLAAVGFLAAIAVMVWNRKIVPMTADQAIGIVFWGTLAGLIGARIWYVIQFSDHYRDNLWEIFRVDQGGLVFYGGLFLALLTVLIYIKVQKLSIPGVLDCIAPALALAHLFGRIGCFLNGCCFGKAIASDCPLGVRYPLTSAVYAKFGSVPVHPVQLYEAAVNLVLFFILLILSRKSKRGVTFSCYIIFYGFMRFVLEMFRGDHNHLANEGFTPAQWVGIGMVPVGIVLLLYYLNRHGNKKTA